MPIGAVGATLGAGLLGAGAQIIGANSAAKAQKEAAERAAQVQLQMYNQGREDTAPFRAGGTSAFNALLGLVGGNEGGNPLTAPLTRAFAPTMEELEKTPGYQFSLDQGLKAVQNSAAARGLGSSGAALKGAEKYAQGLASTTYQQQLDNYMKQNQQVYNMLMGPSQLGANAASGSAGQAAALGQGLAQTYTGAGNAEAAAYNSMGGAIGNALNNSASAYSQQQILQQLLAARGMGAMANPNALGA